MRLLLDTRALLWWLADAPALGPSARGAIASAESAVAFSAASAWEIAIKRAAGRLVVPDDLLDRLGAEAFDPLPMTPRHAWHAGALPAHHADPFDRMLVAQAAIEGMTLVTADPQIARYDVHRLDAGS